MKKDLPIGITDYRKLKERNLYHVDKTLMIKELLEDKGTLVTLITRPRRFGKTLNMSMISEFFDITKDSKEIFQGTKIMKSEYASEINQYPVIYITFKAASGTKEKVISRIKEQLQNVYGYYYSILEKVDMNIFEKNNYEYIIQELNNRNSRLGNVSNALLFLTNMLNKYYNKGVIVIIDEYDMPFIEAHVNGFYDDIHDDLSSILSETFKDNSYVEFGILTGIQRVAKGNTLSKFNNPAVYTVADDKYSSYFGFDYHETKQLLEYYELELNDDVKAMYDGYHIGNTYVYNPWSILNYVKNHNLKPYWVNTSSNIMIKNAIRKADASFKTGFETLIENGYLDANVKMETSFYEESETSTL
ncbi:MAG: AAA family ATPase [Erysipelotrichaceae bacterium]|nr:AAA family ATPase [Erysipelotrichaceae bacterium]